MKILQIHTRYRERGGEDVVVDHEAELLTEAGHHVVRYIVRNPDTPLRSSAALAAGPWNARQARRLASVIRRTTPDVAHVHNTWFALSPSVFRTLGMAGVPTVLTLHNYRLVCANGMFYRDGRVCEECIGGTPWRAVRHRCYRDSTTASLSAAGTIAFNRWLGTWANGVDVFVALTDFGRRKFVEAGLPSERVVVLPNTVADPGARPVPPDGSNEVLFVGRISTEKGVDLLLEAWPHLDDLSLTVVGDGPLRQSLRRRHPNISFPGWLPRDEVMERMLASRALVVPSRTYEGLPGVVLEALAAGLPVMASDTGGLGDAIEPLGPRWRIGGGAAEWANGLGALTDDDEVHGAGIEARRTFESSFNEVDAVPRLMEIYRRARAHRERAI